MITNKTAQAETATDSNAELAQAPLDVLPDKGDDMGAEPVYAEIDELLEEYSDSRFQKVIRGSFGKVFEVAELFRKLDRRRQVDWEKEAEAA